MEIKLRLNICQVLSQARETTGIIQLAERKDAAKSAAAETGTEIHDGLFTSKISHSIICSICCIGVIALVINNFHGFSINICPAEIACIGPQIILAKGGAKTKTGMQTICRFS